MLLISLWLLLVPGAQAQNLNCSSLFVVSSTAPSTRERIEALNLSEVSKQGRYAIRSHRFGPTERAPFEQILKLTEQDLIALSTGQLLQIYTVFAHWNLLPPAEFQQIFWAQLETRLPDWRERHFSYYAFSRKLTPMVPPLSFQQKYQQQLLRQFSDFSANTKMEVLGAELFHSTRFSTRDTHRLLQELTESVRQAPVTFRLKPLKELYRGLLTLRALEPSLFFHSLVPLEQAIQAQLLTYGLSLDLDGTSGAQNDQHAVSPSRLQFELRLDEHLNHSQKLREYAAAGVPGFYDPVDLFYPDQYLIVEWDGHHHYFRTLWSDARLNTDIPRVLRPMDQIKDISLRRQGYKVLRISPEYNGILEMLEIEDLIQSQNP